MKKISEMPTAIRVMSQAAPAVATDYESTVEPSPPEGLVESSTSESLVESSLEAQETELPDYSEYGLTAVDECIGELDVVVNAVLHGWAHGPATEKGKRVFFVYIDGELIAETTPTVVRHDLVWVDNRGGSCGFEIELPEDYLDGREHVFSLRIGPGPESELSQKTLIVPARDIPVRTEPVKGYMDTMIGLYVHGWAYDPHAPSTPVEVELLANGEVCAQAVANMPRDDLRDSGLDSPFHAFAIRVPNALHDGKVVELEVRECRTGSILQGKRLSLGRGEATGQIDSVEGAYLTGSILDPLAFGVATELHLWVDGEQTGIGLADQPLEDGQGNRFWVRIPDRFLDNRYHEVAISAVEDPSVVFDVKALFLKSSSTPFDALQKYAGTSYIKGFLAPLAPQRYESSRRNVALLADKILAANEADLPSIKRDITNFFKGQETVIKGVELAPIDLVPIEFTVYDKPTVSIVIPVHNKFSMTYACLASIAGALNKASYEVVIVDDGSKDDTIRIEELISGITLVKNRAALGFVMACNAGAEVVRGEYIVMLNNDTEVMSGWLDELLDPFTRFEKVGMTGAKLIYPSGVLQEAGGIVWGDGQPWNVGRNGNASDPRYNYTRQVDYLSGACIMLPTSLWRRIGGFDLHFAPAYYEDTDLAFSVRALGYKTVFTPFCEVVHYEGVSNGTDTGGSGLKRFQEINQPKFKAKWSHAYRYNGVASQEAAQLVKDRNVSHRVLVIDAQTLTPDLDAGSYSATQEIRILQSLGFKVTFLPSNLAYMAGYTEYLQRMGVEVLYAPFVQSMQSVITERSSEFDLFYIARYGVAMGIIDHIKEVKPNARIILNIHDLHFLRELREAIASRDPRDMAKAVLTRDDELATIRKADVVVSYSEVEQAIILSHNLDAVQTAACPWVVNVVDTPPGYHERKDIAFLGGFGHRPNLEAVQWFVTEVMPGLRKRMPGVRFLIYGSKAPKALKDLESQDIVLKGYVKTTEEVYDSARVFIAPLLTGAGLKGKVIGAFARGVPTVMTPTAAEGTGARNGLEAFVASKPEYWVAAITKIYQDEAIWNRMSEACRELARDEYSFAKGQEKIQAALQLAGVFVNNENQALWSTYPVG